FSEKTFNEAAERSAGGRTDHVALLISLLIFNALLAVISTFESDIKCFEVRLGWRLALQSSLFILRKIAPSSVRRRNTVYLAQQKIFSRKKRPSPL
ncbi:hypothetical protein L9F63_024204, partial [Diploptera punctata]